MKERIFISSVQKELADERRAIREYIHGDALLRRFFNVSCSRTCPPLTAVPTTCTSMKWVAVISTWGFSASNMGTRM